MNNRYLIEKFPEEWEALLDGEAVEYIHDSVHDGCPVGPFPANIADFDPKGTWNSNKRTVGDITFKIKNRRWKPKEGEEFYFVGIDLDVRKAYYGKHTIKDINQYRTEKHAGIAHRYILHAHEKAHEEIGE